jgi:hypothetical protein
MKAHPAMWLGNGHEVKADTEVSFVKLMPLVGGVNRNDTNRHIQASTRMVLEVGEVR